MLKHLKTRHPIIYLVLLLYSFLVNGVLYFKADIIPPIDHSFICELLKCNISLLPQNFLVTISILLVIIQAIFINKIIIRFNLIGERNTIPSFIYVSLLAIFPKSIILGPSILSMFLVLEIIRNLLNLFDKENAIQKLFFISLIIGLTSLVYSPLIFLIVLLFITFPILKRPSLWELSIIPIGLFVSFYLFFFYFYINNNLSEVINLFLNSFPLWKY
ncbi:MAG: hypothetical protein U9R42_06940, partial [Bacteroidota bacterium]|nr:hypothetical protein [Bacteroidota bacterium]